MPPTTVHENYLDSVSELHLFSTEIFLSALLREAISHLIQKEQDKYFYVCIPMCVHFISLLSHVWAISQADRAQLCLLISFMASIVASYFTLEKFILCRRNLNTYKHLYSLVSSRTNTEADNLIYLLYTNNNPNINN